MNQHGDRIMLWIALSGALAFFAVVAVFAVGASVERRAERLREAVAVLLPAASTVDVRPVEAIAADGMTDAERADAARDARIAVWEHDVDYFRRRDLATMDQYTVPLAKICDTYQRAKIAAYDDAELAVEGFGFPIQRDRARMAALYERAHTFDEMREMGNRPLTVTVDATDTHEWTPAEVAEMNQLLDAGQAQLNAERAAVPA